MRGATMRRRLTRRLRRTGAAGGHGEIGRWTPRLASLAAAAALTAGGNLAQAHEPWVLSAKEAAELRHQPLSRLFSTLNAINLSVALALALTGSVWFWLDRRLAHEPRALDMIARLRRLARWSPVILRLSLSVLLLWGASKGALFVPELNLWEVGAPGLLITEAALAALLALGVYPRVAALLLLALEGTAVALFGMGAAPYAGIIGGPALYLLARGGGEPVPPVWPWGGTLKRWSIGLWRHAHTVLRVLVGLQFIYLGVAIKYLTPGLFTTIVVRFHFPTLGLPPEVITLFAAAVEGGAGLALTLGLLPRVTAALLALSFVGMTMQLQEDVLGHVIFFGIAAVIFLEGKEGPAWLRSGEVKPAEEDRQH